MSLADAKDLNFRDELSLNLTFPEESTVFHVVELATHLSAATFLDSHESAYIQSLDGIWLSFDETCCAIYRGVLKRLRTD